MCSEDVGPGAAVQPQWPLQPLWPRPGGRVPLCPRLPPPLPQLPRPLGTSAGSRTSEADPEWSDESGGGHEVTKDEAGAGEVSLGPGEAGPPTPRSQEEEAGPEQVSVDCILEPRRYKGDIKERSK